MQRCCNLPLSLQSVCVASVFVLVESWNFDQNTVQIQYDSALFSLWAAVEVNMAVFAGNHMSLDVNLNYMLIVRLTGSLPMLKPIFRRMFPTAPNMSTEGESSRHERQATPPQKWRLGRSNKTKQQRELDTLPHPVHMEHVVPRSSVAQERDIEHQRHDDNLWEDDNTTEDDARPRGERHTGPQEG